MAIEDALVLGQAFDAVLKGARRNGMVIERAKLSLSLKFGASSAVSLTRRRTTPASVCGSVERQRRRPQLLDDGWRIKKVGEH
jgi:hypothetical protein